MIQIALPGETVNDTVTTCSDDCGETLTIGVYSSAAGHYVGFFCPHCGPYSRESGYYRTREEAEKALNSGFFGR